MIILIKFIIILSILSPLKSYDFDTDTVKTKELTYAVELFSDGYVIPWGMAFCLIVKCLLLIFLESYT